MGRAYEFRETRLRLLVIVCVTVTVGAAYAALLIFGLRVTYAVVPPRAPVRVAFAAAPAAAPPSGESAPVERAQLPIDVPEVPRPQKTKPVRESAPPPAEPSPSASSATAQATRPTPPAPPAPPDEYAALQGRSYPETPGGPVMVMALLLDSEGVVQNARIMVPSNNPAGDLTYLMVLPGTRVPLPQPPIAPGETRWIELRFRYESEAVLP